jgi:hypothetical protein
LGRSRWFSGSVAATCWLGGSAPAICPAFVFYAVVVAMAAGTLSEVWGDVQRAAGAAAAITEAHHHVPTLPTAAIDFRAGRSLNRRQPQPTPGVAGAAR